MDGNLREVVIVLGLTSIGCICYFFQPGLSGLVVWTIEGVLLLGLFSFVFSYCKKYFSGRANLPDVTLSESQSKKAADAFKKKQNDYSEQAKDYEERILKPREERKWQEREEAVFRFSGPAWKGKGNVLQPNDGESVAEPSRDDKTGRAAAEVRKTLFAPPRPGLKIDKPKPAPKKLVLPDEPEAGSEGVITLAFRTPSGRLLKRKFLISNTVQLLLDYITVMGYPQRHYTVCTSYPRSSLSESADKTLTDIGIIRDCLLNVEEKDTQ